MSEPPLQLLKDLASEEAQVRWIVDATPDEYLLPEELLSDAVRFCELMKAAPPPITSRQMEAVRALAATLDGAGDFLDRYDRSSISELVERDPTWGAIRTRAAEVVKVFTPKP